MPRVFFITGSNRGFGHSMAQVFLDAGEYVVATARDRSTLSFHSVTTDNYLPLKLDVTSHTDIETAFAAALKKFSRIDVVINNAAHGLVGPLETLTGPQIQQQFDTNFFSVVAITRKAISTMRTQSPPGGMIIQISSIGGMLGFPLVSAMCASKWAVEGFTEGVRQEMKPEWGIKLLTVKPDMMHTEAHTRSMVYGEVDVPAYDHMDGKAWVKTLLNIKGTDTIKVAKEVYELSKMADPPGMVMLGVNVLEMARQKVEKDRESLYREDLVEIAKRCSVEGGMDDSARTLDHEVTR